MRCDKAKTSESNYKEDATAFYASHRKINGIKEEIKLKILTQKM